MKSKLLSVLLAIAFAAPAHAGLLKKVLVGAAATGAVAAASTAAAQKRATPAEPASTPETGTPAPAPAAKPGYLKKGTEYGAKRASASIPDRPECRTFKDQIQTLSSGDLPWNKVATGVMDIKRKAKAAGCAKQPA